MSPSSKANQLQTLATAAVAMVLVQSSFWPSADLCRDSSKIWQPSTAWRISATIYLISWHPPHHPPTHCQIIYRHLRHSMSLIPKHWLPLPNRHYQILHCYRCWYSDSITTRLFHRTQNQGDRHFFLLHSIVCHHCYYFYCRIIVNLDWAIQQITILLVVTIVRQYDMGIE